MQPASSITSLIRLAPSALIPVVAQGDANINVLSLALGTLPQLRSALMTGDAITCKNAACGGAMNKWTKRNGDRWTCDFCSQENVAELEEPEIPTQPSLDYVLEPSKAPAGAAVPDDTAVIFCIDVSGSMCVTTEYEGTLGSTDTKKKAEEMKLLNPEGGQQRLPKEKKNMQYISRLAAVQTALKGQIDAMAKNHSQRKIGVVTFSSEVEIIGDASTDPVHIAGDQLSSWDSVIASGEAYPLNSPVQQSKDRLWGKIKNLEEGGATALGPALAAAVALAGKRAGSRVVICTDGLANVGLGSLDDLKTDAHRAESEGFYQRVAQRAKDKGVSVSVLSIAGTECRLENLGMVADATGGAVNLVSPIDMAQNFSEVLADQLIATNVSLTCLVSPCFNFEVSPPTAPSNRLKIDLGNLTTASEQTLALLPKPAAEKATEAKLQVQVAYRQLDGALRVHIATLNVPVTLDRATAEKCLDVGIIGAYVSRSCATMVQDGKYQQVRATSTAYKLVLTRAANNDHQRALLARFNQEMVSAENALQVAERSERLAGLNILDENAEHVAQFRSRVRGDETAQKMYMMKGKDAASCCVQ